MHAFVLMEFAHPEARPRFDLHPATMLSDLQEARPRTKTAGSHCMAAQEELLPLFQTGKKLDALGTFLQRLRLP
jgi:hypothetical protein